jgi:hypothetical protein
MTRPNFALQRKSVAVDARGEHTAGTPRGIVTDVINRARAYWRFISAPGEPSMKRHIA